MKLYLYIVCAFFILPHNFLKGAAVEQNTEALRALDAATISKIANLCEPRDRQALRHTCKSFAGPLQDGKKADMWASLSEQEQITRRLKFVKSYYEALAKGADAMEKNRLFTICGGTSALAILSLTLCDVLSTHGFLRKFAPNLWQSSLLFFVGISGVLIIPPIINMAIGTFKALTYRSEMVERIQKCYYPSNLELLGDLRGIPQKNAAYDTDREYTGEFARIYLSRYAQACILEKERQNKSGKLPYLFYRPGLWIAEKILWRAASNDIAQ